ncbi:hypothetical protein [Clostridium chrysemydis]|uniref:hypothetical protein n=1 Tax=Clostridium chrysemydis TaxID=2665504 RepID=UPI001EE5B132|nr:hypothetical protein [Clostridium chrysemydis]
MAEGWIKLYRNIQEHWIWQDSQKLKWWLDILLLANHKENKFLLGNDLVSVERGEHHTSELKLAARWGVSKTTVRKFLELLKSENMIELKKSKKGTTLKVCNYNDYQDFSEGEKTIKKPRKNHSVDHKETIKEPYTILQKNHKVYTNNNEKNDIRMIKNEEERKEGEECKEETPQLEPLFYPTESCKVIYKAIGESGYRSFFMNSDIEEDNEKIVIKSKDNIEKSIMYSYISKFDWQINKRIEVI